jgi:membrane associated rhomboid family serine protease
LAALTGGPLRREGSYRPERGEQPRRPWRGRAGQTGGPMFNISPVVLWLAISILTIHLVLALLPDDLTSWLIYNLGLVSARLTGHMAWGPFDPATLVTYQFLHGGLEHLGMNLLALLAFGVGLERWIGPWRFLALYLLCGIAGGLAQTAVFPDGMGPLIGASGAISGCFAAIIRLMAGAAQARGGGLAGMKQVGIVALVWVGSQLAFGLVGGDTMLGLVAWWAHIGGFVAGLILIQFLMPRTPA